MPGYTVPGPRCLGDFLESFHDAEQVAQARAQAQAQGYLSCIPGPTGLLEGLGRAQIELVRTTARRQRQTLPRHPHQPLGRGRRLDAQLAPRKSRHHRTRARPVHALPAAHPTHRVATRLSPPSRTPLTGLNRLAPQKWRRTGVLGPLRAQNLSTTPRIRSRTTLLAPVRAPICAAQSGKQHLTRGFLAYTHVDIRSVVDGQSVLPS